MTTEGEDKIIELLESLVNNHFKHMADTLTEIKLGIDSMNANLMDSWAICFTVRALIQRKSDWR